jgi:hypothetical protein
MTSCMVCCAFAGMEETGQALATPWWHVVLLDLLHDISMSKQ